MAREVTVKISAQDSFSPTLQRYQREMGQAEQATRRTSDAGLGLNAMLGGLGVAIGAAQIGRLALDMNDLGREIQFVETRFDALTGGELALAGLRAQTGGVIDDFQLMRDATSFIMTGVAEDAEEAGRLIGMGFRLGGEEGVEALGRALRNQSIEMLDNIGISAAAVRELRNEYVQAGMDASQAFARATLEIGVQTEAMLGNAAMAAQTALSRIETDFENTVQNLSVGISTLTEAAAQAAIDAAEHTQRSIAESQTRASQIDARGQVIMPELMQGMGNGLDAAFVEQFVQQVLHDLANNPDIANQAQLTGEQIGEYVNLGITMAAANPGIESMVGGASNLEQYLANIAHVVQQQNRAFEQAAAAQTGQQTAAVQRMDALMATVQDRVTRFNAGFRAEIASQLTEPVMENAAGALQRVDDLMSNIRQNQGAVGGVTLVTSAQASEVQTLADAYDRSVSSLEELNQKGLLSNEALASYQAGRDAMTALADEAQRGLEAMQNMSLATAFGQGVTNPLLGDLSTQALAGLRASGLFEEGDLQKLQDALDLNSGAQTDSSLVFRDQIVPMLTDIAQQYDGAGLTTAINNLEAEIRAARTAGRDPDFLGSIGYAYTMGGGGQQVNVGQGMGWYNVTAQLGLPSTAEGIMQAQQMLGMSGTLHPGTYTAGGGASLVPTTGVYPDMGQFRTGGAGEEKSPEEQILGVYEELNLETAAIQEHSAKWEASMKSVAADSEITAGYLPDLAKDAGLLSGHMKNVEDRGRKFRDFITEVAGKVNVVRVRLDVSDPKNLLGLFNQSPSLFETVKDNGGVVPGT